MVARIRAASHSRTSASLGHLRYTLAVARKEESVDVEALVAEFEQKLERLRVLYEQYFLGVQKREPQVQLKDVVRVMRKLDAQQIRNTALRFRFRTAVQKLNTYRTYWKRTMRAIEAGTYHRDVARARRRLAARGIELPGANALRTASDVERAFSSAAAAARESAKGGEPVRGRPAEELRAQLSRASQPKAARSASAAGEGPTDAELRRLYDRYVSAKQRCGEDVSSIRYDALARKIRAELPKIRRAHGDRRVAFDVEVRDGRAVLKARVKR